MNRQPKKLAEATQYCPTTAHRKILEEGLLVVDVREYDEVKQLAFDVPEIVNIPLSELDTRYVELPRDREILLVCSAGHRSLKACYFLMFHGYDKVANMQHGMDRWIVRGFPVRGEKLSASSDEQASACGCTGLASTADSYCSPSPAINNTCCSHTPLVSKGCC